MDGQAHEVEVSLETRVAPAVQGARVGQAERGARAEQVGLKTTNFPRPP